MTKMYVSNKDETARMFKSDFMEAFSKVHWTVPLYIYMPVIAYFLYRSIFDYQLSIGTILLYIIIGTAIWTFTEYILHRFVFHYTPPGKIGARIHFIFHGVHHDYPNDTKRLVMPPSVSIPLAVLFFLLFQAIFGSVLVAPFFIGFIAGYLFYDISHYAIHHFNMHSKFWLAIKNHHMKHHYQDPNKGYGVSSPFWDVIFRTGYEVKKTQSSVRID
ncbi:MAG: sterol desaturase family protein [Ignavibacterium sp.]|nr:MAG: sterol desaturase family protein [Ignavibacterium sp.]